MRLINSSQQKLIDQSWQKETGLPLLLLMENAAQSVRMFAIGLTGIKNKERMKILLLAGRGQNGGDAFACTRLLATDGYNIVCREIFPEAKLPDEAAANRDALLKLGFELGLPNDDDFTAPVPDLIIDGVFGTGLRFGRPLPEEFVEISKKTEAARLAGAIVVAIDVPSGIDSNTGQVCPGAMKADHTVTFVKVKTGLCATPGRFYAGKIHTASIGIMEVLVLRAIRETSEPERFLIDKPMLAALKPQRSQNSHKGLFGKILIMGGSAGMPGAAVLTAQAAARAGTGLIFMAVSEDIAPLLLKVLPESLVTEVPAVANAALPLVNKLLTPDVTAVIGPGIGSPAWLGDIINVAATTAKGLLLDADALNHLALNTDQAWSVLNARVSEHKLEPAVLTPHPGEFRRLAPDISLDDRQDAALKLALRSGCVVVLKGASTVVASPRGKIWINPTGHDGLAKGGSGDVLSGLTGSLISQGLTSETAAVCAVFLHGLAGEIAATRQARRSVIPGDIVASLGQAFISAGWEEPIISGSDLISELPEYIVDQKE